MKKNLVAVAVLSTLVASQSHAFSFRFIDGNGYSAAEIEEARQTTPKLEDVQMAPFSENDFQTKPWLLEFEYVVIVNKAKEGNTKQTMRVYHRGQFLGMDKVSTGRETFEMQRKTAFHKGPTKSYWSVTPTGYYTPQWLSKDHKSQSWDADMPFAIFYDVENGIALHAANSKTVGSLGKRASGGCVRQNPAVAAKLFEMVEYSRGMTIPQIQRNGEPVLDEAGQIVRSNRITLNGQPTSSYGTLIIVEDVIE